MKNISRNVFSLKALIYGLAICAALSIVLYSALFVFSMYKNFSYAHFVGLLFLWQTQIGASFAILAGSLAASVVLEQTSSARNIEKQKRANRKEALRAILPLALMKMSDYAEQSVDLCEDMITNSRNGLGQNSTHKATDIPNDWILTLTEFIEHSDDADRQPFIETIKKTQIQHSRVKGLVARVDGKKPHQIALRQNAIESCIDSLEIHARASRLFEYSRGDRDNVPHSLSKDDVKTSARLLLTPGQYETEILEAVDRRTFK